MLSPWRPVKPLRHGRVHLLIEDGAYFSKSSAGIVADPSFFGFKLHTLVRHSGAVLSALLSPGNWQSSGDAGMALSCSTSGGIVIGDYGYRGQNRYDAFFEEAGLVRVLPSNDGESHTLISQVRQRLETALSQLCSASSTASMRARSAGSGAPSTSSCEYEARRAGLLIEPALGLC